MTKRVIITLDESIHEMMSKEDLVKLSESIQSFVDFGIIETDEDSDELYIDQEFLIDLVGGLERIRKAAKKYGRDTHDGLIKYPFWEV